jgi:PAS domain-containing protein
MELDGKPVLQAVVRDTTERKLAEEGLKLFRALIDHSSDGIYVMDPATRRFLDVNESGCRAAISQGGLDLWLEQASDFFAGRQRCI